MNPNKKVGIVAVSFLLVVLGVTTSLVFKNQNINEKAELDQGCYDRCRDGGRGPGRQVCQGRCGGVNNRPDAPGNTNPGGSGCGSNTTSSSCNSSCSPTGYRCTWRSDSGSCNTSAQPCTGGDPTSPVTSCQGPDNIGGTADDTGIFCAGCGGFCLDASYTGGGCNQAAEAKCGEVVTTSAPVCDSTTVGAVVIGNYSDTQYAKCSANGLWEPCPTCTIDQLTIVPTHLQSEFDAAVLLRQQQEEILRQQAQALADEEQRRREQELAELEAISFAQRRAKAEEEARLAELEAISFAQRRAIEAEQERLANLQALSFADRRAKVEEQARLDQLAEQQRQEELAAEERQAAVEASTPDFINKYISLFEGFGDEGTIFENSQTGGLNIGGNAGNFAISPAPPSIMFSEDPLALSNYYLGSAYAGGAGAAVSATLLTGGLTIPSVVSTVSTLGREAAVLYYSSLPVTQAAVGITSTATTAYLSYGALDCMLGYAGGQACQNAGQMALYGGAFDPTDAFGFRAQVNQGLNNIVGQFSRPVILGPANLPIDDLANDASATLQRQSDEIVDVFSIDGYSFSTNPVSQTVVNNPIALSNNVNQSVLLSQTAPLVLSPQAISLQSSIPQALWFNFFTGANLANNSVSVLDNVFPTNSLSLFPQTSPGDTRMVYPGYVDDDLLEITENLPNRITVQRELLDPVTSERAPDIAVSSPLYDGRALLTDDPGEIPHLAALIDPEVTRFDPHIQLSPEEELFYIGVQPSKAQPDLNTQTEESEFVRLWNEYVGNNSTVFSTEDISSQVEDISNEIDRVFTNNFSDAENLPGCRSDLCDISANFTVSLARNEGLPANRYSIEDINHSRGVQSGSFEHEITIIGDNPESTYLVDKTFVQFVNSADGTIQQELLNGGTVVSEHGSENPLAQQLIDHGYFRLTDESLNEYLDLVTANGDHPRISLADLNGITPSRATIFTPQQIANYRQPRLMELFVDIAMADPGRIQIFNFNTDQFETYNPFLEIPVVENAIETISSLPALSPINRLLDGPIGERLFGKPVIVNTDSVLQPDEIAQLELANIYERLPVVVGNTNFNINNIPRVMQENTEFVTLYRGVSEFDPNVPQTAQILRNVPEEYLPRVIDDLKSNPNLDWNRIWRNHESTAGLGNDDLFISATTRKEVARHYPLSAINTRQNYVITFEVPIDEYNRLFIPTETQMANRENEAVALGYFKNEWITQVEYNLDGSIVYQRPEIPSNPAGVLSIFTRPLVRARDWFSERVVSPIANLTSSFGLGGAPIQQGQFPVSPSNRGLTNNSSEAINIAVRSIVNGEYQPTLTNLVGYQPGSARYAYTPEPNIQVAINNVPDPLGIIGKLNNADSLESAYRILLDELENNGIIIVRDPLTERYRNLINPNSFNNNISDLSQSYASYVEDGSIRITDESGNEFNFTHDDLSIQRYIFLHPQFDTLPVGTRITKLLHETAHYIEQSVLPGSTEIIDGVVGTVRPNTEYLSTLYGANGALISAKLGGSQAAIDAELIGQISTNNIVLGRPEGYLDIRETSRLITGTDSLTYNPTANSNRNYRQISTRNFPFIPLPIVLVCRAFEQCDNTLDSIWGDFKTWVSELLFQRNNDDTGSEIGSRITSRSEGGVGIEAAIRRLLNNEDSSTELEPYPGYVPLHSAPSEFEVVVFVTDIYNDYLDIDPNITDKDGFVEYLFQRIGDNRQFSYLLDNPNFTDYIRDEVSRWFGFSSASTGLSRQLTQCVTWAIQVSIMNPNIDIGLVGLPLNKAYDIYEIASRIGVDNPELADLNNSQCNGLDMRAALTQCRRFNLTYYITSDKLAKKVDDLDLVSRGDCFVYGSGTGHTGCILEKYIYEGEIYVLVTEANSPVNTTNGTPQTYIVSEDDFESRVNPLDQIYFVRSITSESSGVTSAITPPQEIIDIINND